MSKNNQSTGCLGALIDLVFSILCVIPYLISLPLTLAMAAVGLFGSLITLAVLALPVILILIIFS